jgi:hypothetical protein
VDANGVNFLAALFADSRARLASRLARSWLAYSIM